MSFWRHNVDVLEEHITEMRIDRGWPLDWAEDFDTFPATDDEMIDAEIWFTERQFGE